jgi:hypothetical protein
VENVLRQIASHKNLELAWRRITAARNTPYKNFFRHLYTPYELALKANLEDLSQRVLGGSYVPHRPIRVYQPKASGLQRPLSLLYLEDQILLQAMANVFEKKIGSRRAALHYTTVYSNISDGTKGIFFIKPWPEGWTKYHKDSEKHFQKGYVWVAKFDLSAFYDTISHSLLLSILYPRSFRRGASTTASDTISKWFSCWSSELNTGKNEHGLPQGPIASDFLAECLMLKIDLTMRDKFQYMRYVDDILLFGKTEFEVREAIIKLEVLCREHGLIPQSSKTGIKRITSVDELQFEPISLKDEDVDEGVVLKHTKANALFHDAVDLTAFPPVIKDRSKLRFTLFRASPSITMKKMVVQILPYFPEHIDALVIHLLKYGNNDDVFALCKDLIFNSPYDYVRGQLLLLISATTSKVADDELIRKAIDFLTNGSGNFILNWGACRFLVAAETSTGRKYANFAKKQRSLLSGLLLPELPPRLLNDVTYIEEVARRSQFEANITIGLMKLNTTCLAAIGTLCSSGVVPGQSVNSFRATGIIPGAPFRADSIDEILRGRFGITRWKKWSNFFGAEYSDACSLLFLANAAFNSGRTNWLAYQNSFNHLLYTNLNNWLQTLSFAGYENPTFFRGGRLRHKDYGTLVASGSLLDHAYPALSLALREANRRRNVLPSSHPYDRRSGGKAQHLTAIEQKALVGHLKRGYLQLITILDAHL